MSHRRFLIAVTLANVAILAATALVATRPVSAQPARDGQDTQGVAPVLRTRALQIVDDRGRVRASIAVLPASTSAHGDRSPETVLLRLITERGRPSVKIGASEEASGVSLVGPSGTTDTYTILEAKGTVSSLRLRNENGREYVVRP